MDEGEWLSSEDGARMIERLLCWGGGHMVRLGGERPSDRKLRLFALACARHRGEPAYATPEKLQYTRIALEVAERFADGEASADELARAYWWEWPAAFVVGENASWCARQFSTDESGVSQSLVPLVVQANLLREIFGNPFRPVTLPEVQTVCGKCGSDRCTHEGGECCCDDCGSDSWFTSIDWRTPTVLSLAQAAYDERPVRECARCKGRGKIANVGRGYLDLPDPCQECNKTGRVQDGSLDPARLAVLADALEEAGCESQEVLRHLRGEEECRVCEAPVAYQQAGVIPMIQVAGVVMKVEGQTFLSSEKAYWPWCIHCKGTGWRKLRGPHVRGCWVVDLVLGRG